MPYRPKDIYRGRRKFRVPLTIFLFVLAFLVLGSVGMFYFLQQYIVYDASGVSLQLPFSAQEEAADPTEPTAKPTFEPLTVEVVWEDPDFSQIDLGGWDELEAVQARFITLDTVISASALESAVNAAKGGDWSAVVLEMKDTSGRLAWASASETAMSYGTAGSADVTETIAALHEADMTVAAQISCFADDLMGTRNWPTALSYGGGPYRDDDGVYWLDPYNRTIRTYLADLVRELAAMGFDEIILADLYHPLPPGELGFGYSVTLQTAADPVVAVCQSARRIVEAAAGTGVAVSALLDTASLREGRGAQTGQDVDIFWRLFARLYCPTSTDMYSSDKELAVEAMNAGDSSIRFVPVSSLIPEGAVSYMITG